MTETQTIEKVQEAPIEVKSAVEAVEEPVVEVSEKSVDVEALQKKIEELTAQVSELQSVNKDSRPAQLKATYENVAEVEVKDTAADLEKAAGNLNATLSYILAK